MIYAFEVGIRPGNTDEAYADAWARASEIIQAAPGAPGTRLPARPPRRSVVWVTIKDEQITNVSVAL